MNRSNYRKWPVKAAFCLQLMLALLPACTDDPEVNGSTGGKEGTATLELSLSVPPMMETRAVVCEAGAGSEARKAGFHYEMQVITTDTLPADSQHPATRAAETLKNVYAFLFKSNGAFNGRASLETTSVGSLFLTFTDIGDLSAMGGQLVVVANDGVAGVDYTSSTAFADFSGTYAEFQDLQLTSQISASTDIPYVGTAGVSLSAGAFTTQPTVELYRMLAEIRLTNNTFTITGGPSRCSIDLYRAGKNYFGTPAGYDGTGETPTDAKRYLETAVPGENADNNTWYVGENIQSDASNAAYIRLASDIGSGGNNRNPAIGEEYYIAGGSEFTYDVYLNSFALRRNTIYNITVSVNGTLAGQEDLAKKDPNVTCTTWAVARGGLNIGKFGGASGYTTGTGDAPTVAGTYTKNLLIQSNTSGTQEDDTVNKSWTVNNQTPFQPENCKYWDHIYTAKHMDTSAGRVYDYCYTLTLGGVDEGTWYVPSQAQLLAILGILKGIKENSSYAYYFAFVNHNYYWSSTECGAYSAWGMNLINHSIDDYYNANSQYYVRCVRDI